MVLKGRRIKAPWCYDPGFTVHDFNLVLIVSGWLDVKGCGPYLSLLNADSFEELSKTLVLKYRVIHKIVIEPSWASGSSSSGAQPSLVVFGQKSFAVLGLNAECNRFEPQKQPANDDQERSNVTSEGCFEMPDWIFDICWLDASRLIIVCAHNQCFFFNLTTSRVYKTTYCVQKCLL